MYKLSSEPQTMNTLDKDELLHWLNKYNDPDNAYNSSLESELRSKFQQDRFMTKDDLECIVRWKFQGRLLGRQKIILNLLAPIDDQFIETVSRVAFEANDDVVRLKMLCSINGVGNALSSVILSFLDPQQYGIFDIHAWRELFGKEPADFWSSQRYVLEFFTKLREISTGTDLCCRDIEKALFMKNYKEKTVPQKLGATSPTM